MFGRRRKQHRRRRLGFENLEDRSLLAVAVNLIGGDLFIDGDNTANDLVLTETAGASTFEVENNAAVVGSYDVTGKIVIRTGDDIDNVTIDMAGSPTSNVPGALQIITRAGNDEITIAGGAVNGVLIVAAGDDDDTVGAIGVNLNGAYSLIGGGTGDDSLTIINSSQVASRLLTSDVNEVDLNVDLSSSTFQDISVSNSEAGIANMFILGGNATVTGSVRYYGSNENDEIILDADVAGPTVIDARGGDNSLRLQVLSSATLGDLYYTGRDGNDTIWFSTSGPGATTITGDVRLNTGDGDNTYAFNNAFTVSGYMNITGGSGIDAFGAFDGVVGVLTINAGAGDNNIDLQSTSSATRFTWYGADGNDDITLATSLSGTLYINAGAGNNTLNLTSTSSVAQLIWNSGDGEDDITLAGLINGPAYIRLGDGSDSLNIASTATVAGVLYVDFGPGVDIYNPDPLATLNAVYLRNIP